MIGAKRRAAFPWQHAQFMERIDIKSPSDTQSPGILIGNNSSAHGFGRLRLGPPTIEPLVDQLGLNPPESFLLDGHRGVFKRRPLEQLRVRNKSFPWDGRFRANLRGTEGFLVGLPQIFGRCPRSVCR